MTTASTLLAPMATPLLVLWLSGSEIDVDAMGMFRSILIVTIIPVALGAFANFFFGRRKGYQELCGVMPGVSVIGLACIVGGVIAWNGEHFFTSGAMIFAAVFLHNALGYAAGYLVGRCTGMSMAKKRTIAIEVGMQNAGLATNLATRHFPTLPEAAIASAVSCVWHSISGTLLAGLFLFCDRIRAARAYLLVGRRFDGGLRVADRGVRDAVDVLEVALQSPEAAAGEVCGLRISVIVFVTFAHAPHVTTSRRLAMQSTTPLHRQNRFRGADSAFAGGLLPFQGAGRQLDRM